MSDDNTFRSNCATIELTEKPWSVRQHQSVYVKKIGNDIRLFHDESCLEEADDPLQLGVYRGQSTGLYFYIAEGSDEGTCFPDPEEQLPISWKKTDANPDGTRPPTVRYGKMTSKRKAFSMSDQHPQAKEIRYHFDIVLDPGGGAPPISTAPFEKVDPTIVEKAEGPPSGGGDGDD